MDFNSRAKEIIGENIYLMMATSDAQSDPWVSPVYCAYDDRFNFYWTSNPDARHSRNIKENGGKITFVIFNSSAAEGTGEGVYFEGSAQELNDERGIVDALRVYSERKHKDAPLAGDFMGAAPRRVYKAIPEKIWMNTDEKIGGYIADGKVEIKLI